MAFSVYGCRHVGENEANLHGENDYDFAKDLLIETDSLDNSDVHLSPQRKIELLTKSGLTYDEALAGKVYFVGPFDIYLELVDGRIIDLMPQSGTYPLEISRSQLEEKFQ